VGLRVLYEGAGRAGGEGWCLAARSCLAAAIAQLCRQMISSDTAIPEDWKRACVNAPHKPRLRPKRSLAFFQTHLLRSVRALYDTIAISSKTASPKA
jgi:hypothetical protein